MKTASAGLDTHIGLNCSTLATCWKITATDATVRGFTNHTQDLTFNSQLYRSTNGFTPTSVSSSAGFPVDNLDVQAALILGIIDEDDFLSGKWDFADIEIFLVNYKDLTMDELKIRKGTLGELTVHRNHYVAEVRGLGQRLTKHLLNVYQPSCRADLGDSLCGVTIASFTVTGTVASVSSNRIFADTSRSEADDWFNFGKLTWTSGANNGREMEVKDFVNATGQIELWAPMFSDVEVGDTYSMFAGCDKDKATCKTKFSNIVNFRGEPFVPQRQALSAIST
jgi:uncharacterized phage protein (TIGR02218 family)